MFANPNRIELVHGLLDQFGVVGEDSGLEVARAFTFHANACTSEVGTADIGHLAVEDQHLEMYPWTECPFKTIEQSWIFVEVFTEGWPWLLGMNEPDFDTFINKLSQDRKERLLLCVDLDIKVFDVTFIGKFWAKSNAKMLVFCRANALKSWEISVL